MVDTLQLVCQYVFAKQSQALSGTGSADRSAWTRGKGFS